MPSQPGSSQPFSAFAETQSPDPHVSVRVSTPPKPQPSARPVITRRRLLKSLFACGVLGALPLGAGWASSRKFDITHHDLALPGLPASLQGLTLLQLTDIHSGVYISPDDIADMLQAAASQKPDLVVLTGDYVTRNPNCIHPLAEQLKDLHAPLGVYAVPGNHDNAAGRQVVLDALKGAGVQLLINTSATIEEGFHLLGVDDAWTAHADIAGALRGVSPKAARIMLTHNPALLDQVTVPITLLAGHTHGGQVYLGKQITGAIVPDVTCGGRFFSGWYKNGRASMYISRGVGLVGLPLRLFCPPEITVFRLVAPAV